MITVHCDREKRGWSFKTSCSVAEIIRDTKANAERTDPEAEAIRKFVYS